MRIMIENHQMIIPLTLARIAAHAHQATDHRDQDDLKVDDEEEEEEVEEDDEGEEVQDVDCGGSARFQ